MKKQKIVTRLILTYTLILIIFAGVLLSLFFVLFKNQALGIHKEQMKDQGDMIAETLMLEGVSQQKEETTRGSGHGRMMGNGNHGSRDNHYLQLISRLSSDDIYVVKPSGEAFISSHKNQEKQLPKEGEVILQEVLAKKDSLFLERGLRGDTYHLAYGVPLYDEEKSIIGSVIVLSKKSTLSFVKETSFLIWSTLVALLITIIVSVIIAKRFVKPIHEMVTFTERLIQEDYGIELNIQTKDELARLGDTLSVLSQRLEKAKKAQLNKESSQKLFLSQISHELRTPIMVITNSLESLQDDFLNEEEKQQYITQLLLETKQLQLLVNDLLELSRLQSTEFSISKEEVTLAYVVEDAIRSFRLLLLEKEQQIIFQSDLKEDDVFLGDYQRLVQLIKVLLDNAIKYSPKKSDIHLSLLNQPAHYLLEISNPSSVPLTKRDVAHLFNAFERQKGTTEKGHGLGLTIAKQIVKRHGGEVEIRVTEKENVVVRCFFKK